LAEILPPLTCGLPADTYVLTWDPTLGTIGSMRGDIPLFIPPDPGASFDGIWDPPGPALPPGLGFFIYIDPNTAPNASYTVTFVGEVMQGALSNPLYGNGRYNAVGSQVPQAGKVTTDLGLVPVNEDYVMTWNKNATPPAYNSTILVFTEGSGWNDGQTLIEPELGVGDAMFLVRAANVNQPWTRTFNVN
jgi:hypothetical protein